jgi:hypothetical protein
MFDINIWAALTAAVASFVLGGIWYSPLLFGNIWCREAKVDPEKGHPAKVFGISFIFSILAAFGFAILAGPNPDLMYTLHQALWIGIFFVGACFGINYQFAQNSMVMWLIDAGYHTMQFVVFALIVGLWH